MKAVEQVDDVGCKYHQILSENEHIASSFSGKVFLIRPCSAEELLGIAEVVSQLDKTAVVEQLLGRQKEMASTSNPVREAMKDIEPFSWTDEAMKKALSNNLSPEQMRKMDECGRANLAGQRVMTRALIKAISQLQLPQEGT